MKTEHKQLIKVRMQTASFNSDYQMIGFENEDDAVLHTKAKARARMDFGSQLEELNPTFKVIERMALKH